MQNNLSLSVEINSENDVQALLSLYAGLCAIGKNQPQGSDVLKVLTNQLREQLKSIYPTDKWNEIEVELNGYSDQAAAIAARSEGEFETLKF